MAEIKIMEWKSPAGDMVIGAVGGRLCLCDWVSSCKAERNRRRISRCKGAICGEDETDIVMHAVSQLEEYFSGQRREFTVPLEFAGTEFQCRVWSALMKIPYGETVSYAELARRVGNPVGVRAVAAAVGANPISIFVPCHRIVGSDGSLTGYAGGLRAKRLLLDLEHQPV